MGEDDPVGCDRPEPPPPTRTQPENSQLDHPTALLNSTQLNSTHYLLIPSQAIMSATEQPTLPKPPTS
ncbi:hypothetical protein PCASD_05771 [Puccinia coronata f. sp. avenae]|uniref:Uncharacterized protein n=1 Tax=Puccinia coronata f. sp. avenae TaxID=200324 RepID=A0A2N5V1I2_9BASI|nr:hypothetical protein PCASD_05771 [Puccinia coronata f. sp. avenae]